MRTLLPIFIIGLLAVSCTTRDVKTVKADIKFDTLPLPTKSTVFYFNTKMSWNDTDKDALDTFINAWYSKMLFALKEPIIKDYQGDKEIYRFTWLRTFHHPVSVRLEKQNGIIKLFAKVCDGAGGYEPGQMIFDTTIIVTANEYNLLIKKITNISFWNLTTEKRGSNGTDGSEWIIEGVKDNKYHMVTRWTPRVQRQENFRSVGEYLISLSNISSNETENFY